MKTWVCGNCGEVHRATSSLEELGFQFFDTVTSITRCFKCKSYSLQQAYDETFTAGQFLVVRSYNRIRKGKTKHVKHKPIERD